MLYSKQMLNFLSEIVPAYKSLLTRAPVKTICNSVFTGFPGALLLPPLFIVLLSTPSFADIYRFVTIDGVESFTDAPVNKEARVIIKDSTKENRKGKKTAKKEKTHTISLDEIVARTVQASINPQENQSSSPFEPRLPPVGGVISSGVGMRIDPIDGKIRHHNGIDIAISEGTPITPVAPGIVIYSGQRSGYGNTVLVEHDNGLVTLYGHNSRLTIPSGQPVDTNSVIALSGNTGRSTGPHLHFEAWQAGVNVTPAFMPDSGMQLPKVRMASGKARAQFHKEIMADGSILFTNIPSTTN
jgi:murein DD-endopeptidase MepM/ murein hydrolase activator NlpD